MICHGVGSTVQSVLEIRWWLRICDAKPSSTWWRHQMETFSALLAICAGNSPVPVNSPHKGQWRGALMFSLIWAWINDWINNREAGDLRRNRAHYDVIIMISHTNDTTEWGKFFPSAKMRYHETLFEELARYSETWCVGRWIQVSCPHFVNYGQKTRTISIQNGGMTGLDISDYPNYAVHTKQLYGNCVVQKNLFDHIRCLFVCFISIITGVDFGSAKTLHRYFFSFKLNTKL